jgi:cardiolipin synthase (CMP-forming)
MKKTVISTDRRERIRASVEEKLRPLTLPNFLTLLRIAIVPFFVLAVFAHEFKLAVWIFVISGFTDVLDGWIARTFDMQSRIGALLDPLADKVLLTAAYISLAIPHGQAVVIPLWLAILTLFRDFVIMLMAFVFYMFEGIKSFPPTWAGKLTTVMHVATVSLVLLANVVFIPSMVLNICFYVSFVMVIASGFSYIYCSSRAIEAERQARLGEPIDDTEIDRYGDRRR